MHALLKPTKFGFLNEFENIRNKNKPYFIEPNISQSLKQNILHSHRNSFDWKIGGTRSPIKFIDRDSVEYSLVLASQGNKTEEAMAKLTLDNALSLIDPVWGGVYQYSTKDWHSPHHTKSMNNQAGYLRIYALAYGLLKTQDYLSAAYKIRDYLIQFLLSDSGGFYSKQSDSVNTLKPVDYFSLNDIERRKHGIPVIEKKRYVRENGWAIEALATLYEFSGDKTSLDLAIQTANWIIKNRIFPDGGFRHDKRDMNGPYLSDTLAMARAMLQLYKVTQQEKWLIRTINAADFISLYFKQRGGGFVTHIERRHNANPQAQIDENISLMRLCNLLAHYTDMRRHRGMAKHCLRYLCMEEVATAREDEAGILLADLEYNDKPIEINVLGDLFNKKTQALINVGLRHPLWYKYIGRYKNWQSIFDWQKTTRVNQPFAVIRRDDYESDELRSPKALAQLLLKLI